MGEEVGKLPEPKSLLDGNLMPVGLVVTRVLAPVNWAELEEAEAIRVLASIAAEARCSTFDELQVVALLGSFSSKSRSGERRIAPCLRWLSRVGSAWVRGRSGRGQRKEAGWLPLNCFGDERLGALGELTQLLRSWASGHLDFCTVGIASCDSCVFKVQLERAEGN